MKSNRLISLILHGGAGTFASLKNHETSEYLEAMRRILENGREMLKRGASALDTVEACASQLEDDPLFNAGRGSVLNEAGHVELDAAIMSGRDLSAGAVAGVRGIANPVQLARHVMEASGHVLLIGEGAMRFAEQSGFSRVPDDYFITPQRIEELRMARQQQENQETRAQDLLASRPSHSDPTAEKYGTIGACARDLEGNLAAATSTGGFVNKRVGRVGDTPLIGAGVFADNQSCAVSATGRGEDFMRTVLCKMIADFVFMQGLNIRAATHAAIDYLGRRIQGQGGVIAIDQHGHCASAFNTPLMIRGWIEHSGQTKLEI